MLRNRLILLFLLMNCCLVSAQKPEYFDKYNNQKLYTKAADFNFVIFGQEDTINLYQIQADSIYLFFYDPDCEHCHKEIKHLRRNKKLKQQIKEGKAIVIALAPDISYQEWINRKSILPKQWINAWSMDNDLIIKKYLWKVPELFVLDENKVIHKVEMYREEE